MIDSVEVIKVVVIVVMDEWKDMYCSESLVFYLLLFDFLDFLKLMSIDDYNEVIVNY